MSENQKQDQDQDQNRHQGDGATGNRLVVDPDHAGKRLDRYLCAVVPGAGFGLVQKLVRKGAVRIDGKRARADARVAAQNLVSIPQTLVDLLAGQRPGDGADHAGHAENAEKVSVLTPQARGWLKTLTAGVLFDAGDVLAFNKPAGLAVQGGTNTAVHVDGLLPQFADAQGRVPKLVHRLDRDTSGVLVTARGALAGQLAEKFAARETDKLYWAWCWGRPSQPSGVVNAPLAKRGGQGKRGDQERVLVDDDHGAPAHSDYRVLVSGRLSNQHGPTISLIEWRPRTGRTHQLRVHAAHLGNSIVGDPKYGHPPRLDGGEHDQAIIAKIGLQLHAASLSMSIQGKQRAFAAPPPPTMIKLAHLIHADPQEIFKR